MKKYKDLKRLIRNQGNYLKSVQKNPWAAKKEPNGTIQYTGRTPSNMAKDNRIKIRNI